MQTYATIENMVEEKAISQHKANLESGGVFNADGTRYSDLDTERMVAKKQVRFSPRFGAYVIEKFGIVKPNASLRELA